MCSPGTSTAQTGFACPVIYEIPAPFWSIDSINRTRLDIDPADLCLLSQHMNATWCRNCSAGTYQDTYGATACITCGVDTYSSSNGSVICVDCPADSHIYQPGNAPPVPQVSIEQCLTKCPPGTYSNADSGTTCMPCIPGSFANVGDSSECQPCAVGFYTQQFAAQQCAQCPTGTSTLSLGSNSSSFCLGAAEKNLSDGCILPAYGYDANMEFSDASLIAENKSDARATLGGALLLLQRRILGSASITDQNLTVTLEDKTIADARLSWFLGQATGLTKLVLFNSTCSARVNPSPRFTAGQTLTQLLQCAGYCAIWGYTHAADGGMLPRVTVLFSEVNISGLAASMLHMSLLLVDGNHTAPWRPLRYSGMPLFDGIPRASWVHNLGFGRPDRAMGLVVVQASTVALDFRGCEASACVDLRPEDLAIGMRRSRFSFRKGISFYVRGAYIRLRLDGTYQLLGLEDLVPQVDAPPPHTFYTSKLMLSGASFALT